MSEISIIVPFYKGNQFISQMVLSVNRSVNKLKAIYDDAVVELIIVNDSPDTDVLLTDNESIAEIKIIRHRANYGIHQARLTGLDASTGKYIIFLDQDDEITEDCLLCQYELIDKEDMVLSNAYLEAENGELNLFYKHYGKYKNALCLKAYVKGHNRIISPGHCMIRKASIPREWRDYVLEVNGADDLFLWILMLLKNKKIIVNNQVVYVHRYTGRNLSDDECKMARSSLALAEFLTKISYVDDKLVKDFIRNQEFIIARHEKSGLNKTLCYISNLDILLNRIFWKLREHMGKLCI